MSRRGTRNHQVREWQLSTTNAEEARFGQTVCRHGVHKADTTRNGLSGASVSHHTPTFARLRFALPDVLSYMTSSLTSVSYIQPAPNASKIIDYLHLYEELVTFV